jgi:hypothetical protein
MAGESKVFTGSRGVIKFNGATLADVVGVSWGVQFLEDQLVVCGSYWAVENIPLGGAVSPISVRKVSRRGYDVSGNVDELGQSWAPEDIIEAIKRQDLQMSIVDLYDNKVVHHFSGVRFTGYNGDMAPRQVTFDGMSFIALRYKFERQMA